MGSVGAGDASTRQNPNSSAAATNMGAAGNRNCRRPTASVSAASPSSSTAMGAPDGALSQTAKPTPATNVARVASGNSRKLRWADGSRRARVN